MKNQPEAYIKIGPSLEHDFTQAAPLNQVDIKPWFPLVIGEDVPTPAGVQQLIAEECDAVKELLIKKNQDYGNSFMEPIGIFANESPLVQVDVRIDDKLKRIKNKGDKNISEDTVQDLIGYLILRRVLVKLGY